MSYANSWASQVSTENVYLFMQISPTVSLNYSGKEQNSNVPSNALMLSAPLRRYYAKFHPDQTNPLHYLQMLPTTAILASYIRHKSQINKFQFLTFQEVSTRHSNFGMSLRKNAVLCTGLLINFCFTLEGQSASCIAIISLWHHS